MAITTKAGQSDSARTTQLPGFGPKSTERLAGIGITTICHLRGLDPYEVYARLKGHVPATRRSFLYALLGAHERIDWRKVCKTRRSEILLRLDALGIAPE